MATPYLSEIRIFSFSFPPKGWALCNGQILPINQNQALFALLGTTYGGNGQTTFALPNLQGSMPVHQGNGFVLGHVGGELNHTLIISEMPTHTHSAQASANPADRGTAANNFWANGNQPAYASSANSTMASNALSNVGGSQPHNNQSPFLVLNFCIALQGIFPSQN